MEEQLIGQYKILRKLGVGYSRGDFPSTACAFITTWTISSELPTIQGLATLRCAVRLHPCDRLRKMMLKERKRRNYAETAIDCYVRAVEDFSRHFNCSPDRLSYLWKRC